MGLWSDMRTIVVILGAIAFVFATTGGSYQFDSELTDGYLMGYDPVRANACSGCDSQDTTAISIYVGERYTGVLYYANEGFMKFRITGIGDGETITAADFRFYVLAKGTAPGSGLTINKIAAYDPLTCADWHPAIIAELEQKNASEVTAGQWNTFPVDSDKLSYIENNVTLYVWIDEIAMCIGTPPTGDWRWNIASANRSSGAYAPYLEITTTGGAADRDVYGPWIFTDPNMNPLIRVVR